MTKIVTKVSRQALNDIDRNFTNSIFGTKWMRQQIRKGGIDKRVPIEEAERRWGDVINAIESLTDSMKVSSSYYGYKFYESKNDALYTFYIYKVAKTPFSLIVALAPNKVDATVMRVIVHSVENAQRLLNGKGVTIDRHNTDNYKVCSLNKDNFNFALLESLIAGRF